MTIASLSHIMKLLTGGSLTNEDRHTLTNEALLLTLARATVADSNIDATEVQTVQRIYKARTGETVEAKDVRVAALSDMVAESTLEKYLARVRGDLEEGGARMIAEALAEVLKAEGGIRPFEVEFFESATKALGLTNAELAGLID